MPLTPLACRASPASTRGSHAAYQPARTTTRSLRSASLHSAPCSASTGRAGNGALEPRGMGDGPAWRGKPLRPQSASARVWMGQALGEADFAQRHALPATSHVQPQRRLTHGRALLVVRCACLTPAMLDLPTLQFRMLVESTAGLPRTPDNTPFACLQHTEHAPMRFHRASFLLTHLSQSMTHSTCGVTPWRRSRCARPRRNSAFSAALMRLLEYAAVSSVPRTHFQPKGRT